MGIRNIILIIPPWLLYIGTVAIVIASVYTGFFLARAHIKKNRTDSEGPINTIVAATMGLLAFILAFTFGVTTSRFEDRKSLMLEEVNSIETTYLRCDLIPEPQRSEIQTLLKKYVDIRVKLQADPQDYQILVPESEHLQTLMWDQAVSLSESAQKNPQLVALFINSMNDMFDLQTKRITVATIFRLPRLLWQALFLLIILCMVEVGYLFGLAGKSPNLLLIILLALSFSAMITLVGDLDRSGSGKPGLIRVPSQPMIDLQHRITLATD